MIQIIEIIIIEYLVGRKLGVSLGQGLRHVRLTGIGWPSRVAGNGALYTVCSTHSVYYTQRPMGACCWRTRQALGQGSCLCVFGSRRLHGRLIYLPCRRAQVEV